MRKTYVIGDVHGCYQTLKALLDKISPDPQTDVVVFLGDYVNRGPDSKKVISELLRLQRQFRHFMALMGNHEFMLLNYLAGRDQEFFLMMGGRQTLESYGIDDSSRSSLLSRLSQDHLRFLNDLPAYWEDEDYIYVHGGLQPGVHLTQQTTEWLLWAREKFIKSDYDFGKRIVFGHTPFNTPRIEPNKIGIDTGAVYGGRLTCLVLPNLEFVSVPRETW